MIILLLLHLHLLPTLFQTASLVYLYLASTLSSPMGLEDCSYLNLSNVIQYSPLATLAMHEPSVFYFSYCLYKDIFNFPLPITNYYLYLSQFYSQDQSFQIYTSCIIYHSNLQFILVMEVLALCYHMDCWSCKHLISYSFGYSTIILVLCISSC